MYSNGAVRKYFSADRGDYEAKRDYSDTINKIIARQEKLFGQKPLTAFTSMLPIINKNKTFAIIYEKLVIND